MEKDLGVTGGLKAQPDLAKYAAQKANHFLGCIKRTVAKGSRDMSKTSLASLHPPPGPTEKEIFLTQNSKRIYPLICY